MGTRQHDGDPENGWLPSKHEKSESPAMTGRHELDNIAEGVGKGFAAWETLAVWIRVRLYDKPLKGGTIYIGMFHL